jgi:Zn-dependent protease with chaperone function
LVDRVHFLDEQRRNRRRSLRFSVFAVVAVGLAGIPLCVLVSPLLFGLVLFGAHVVDLIVPLSETQWDKLHDVAFALPDVWAKIRGRPVDVPWSTLAMLYFAPGALVMLLTWPFIQLLSRTAGAGMMLRPLASRDPNPSVLAEQQLANVVQEMAIAAGVPPPAVRIIESSAVNAVAIGLTTDDAVLLATTGFLDRLDREERQAIVAHLVGSVGNGDLEIAAVILSVFQTWGLVALLLETPLDPHRRALVRRFVGLSIQAARGRVDAEEARVLLDRLLTGGGFEFEEFFAHLEKINPRSLAHGCYIILIQLPLIATVGLASIAAKQSIALFTTLVLGPWLAAMWRARRRLADATAVQLTRNPAALARAVRTLDGCDVEVPGGWAVNFLFPVWSPVTEQSAARQTEIAAYVVGMRLDPKVRLERLAALGAALESGATAEPHGLVARLRGALPDWRELRTAIGWSVIAIVAVAVLIAVTLAAASVLLIALWYVLRWVTALPRWIRRQIVGLAMAVNSFLTFHLIHSTFQSFNPSL